MQCILNSNLRIEAVRNNRASTFSQQSDSLKPVVSSGCNIVNYGFWLLGVDLILWMVKNLAVDDVQEALHLAHLMAAHGYFFPTEDHALTVKNDNSYYRFQTPYFWPSNCWEPENTDYGNY